MLVRITVSIRTSTCSRPETWPRPDLATIVSKDRANSTVANTTVANNSIDIANYTLTSNTATNNSSGPTVYSFQVSVGQFNFPDRVLWKGEAFLFAQALAVHFIFPGA